PPFQAAATPRSSELETGVSCIGATEVAFDLFERLRVHQLLKYFRQRTGAPRLCTESVQGVIRLHARAFEDSDTVHQRLDHLSDLRSHQYRHLLSISQVFQ